jgi:hypothetical protein
MDESVWSTGGMILTGENQSTQETNLSQCHFDHLKSHVDYSPGTELASTVIEPILTNQEMPFDLKFCINSQNLFV